VAELILSMHAVARVFLKSRSDTALEILALRQQVAVLKRKRPRPVMNSWDRVLLDDAPPALVTLVTGEHAADISSMRI
jgi:hypothetical protein